MHTPVHHKIPFAMSDNDIRLPKSFVLALEGIPGSGKSSAVDALVKHLSTHGYKVFVKEEKPDPFFLNLYLSNMPRYAFAFQIHMATERRVAMREAQDTIAASPNNTVVILDRSIAGDWAFEKHLRSVGWIDEVEHPAYRAISGVRVGESISVQYPPETTRVVHLSVTPETSLRRIKMRGNTSEIAAYTEAYMTSLIRAYESVLSQCGPVLRTFDWNADVEMENDAESGKSVLPTSAIAPIIKSLYVH